MRLLPLLSSFTRSPRSQDATPTRPTGAATAAQLRALAPDLRFDGLASESDQPVSVVWKRGPVATLDESTFKSQFGLDGDGPTQQLATFVDGAPLLPKLFGVDRTRTDAQTGADILRGLRNLKAVVVGADGAAPPVHPTYLVGVAADGAIVGLKTAVVWT